MATLFIAPPVEHPLMQERRVALTPSVAGKLATGPHRLRIPAGAGVGAGLPDQAYRDAGVDVVDDVKQAWAEADLVLTVSSPDPGEVRRMKPGAVLVGGWDATRRADLVDALLERSVTGLATSFIPRITRAQAMDVLSSQANMAGYVAAVRGAEACPKMFPMMITAAGTIAPARVFVLGAGVAGLQAIATAKRLGAVVEAYDIRPAVKEQVQSLGARFVELPAEANGASESAETAGGYAKQQSDADRQRQAELMAKHVTGADVVIATAAVFGKAPPMLIPSAVVDQMKPGSVLVDLAADADAGRGNAEITRPGQRYTTERGVTIDGRLNLPSAVPVHASQALANNMKALLGLILTDDGGITLDDRDPILRESTVTRDGLLRHPIVGEALGREITPIEIPSDDPRAPEGPIDLEPGPDTPPGDAPPPPASPDAAADVEQPPAPERDTIELEPGPDKGAAEPPTDPREARPDVQDAPDPEGKQGP